MTIQGPFPSTDLCAYWMSYFVQGSDIPQLATVCKLWNQAMDTPEFWKGLYICKGIPMVSDEKGPRDYRNDFHIVYPATRVSGEIMRKTFGEPVGGKMPCIKVEVFNKLPRPGEVKKPDEIVDLIVAYPAVRRVLCTKKCPLDLDSSGNLVKVSIPDGTEVDGKPTVIPFTLRNIIMLGDYPPTGEEHMPVLSWIFAGVPGYQNHGGIVSPCQGILSQCDYLPMGIEIWHQTRTIVDGTEGMDYATQEASIQERGEEVLPLRPRLLFDAVEILEYGTCPDSSYVQTSTRMDYFGMATCQVNIGGFRSEVSRGSDSEDFRTTGFEDFGSEDLRTTGFEDFGSEDFRTSGFKDFDSEDLRTSDSEDFGSEDFRTSGFKDFDSEDLRTSDSEEDLRTDSEDFDNSYHALVDFNNSGRSDRGLRIDFGNFSGGVVAGGRAEAQPALGS